MPKAEEGENDFVLETALGRNTLFDMTGKVVLVTGGGSGIGAMIAGGFAANGADVYICSRKDCSAFANQLTQKGPGKCKALTADVTKQEDIDRIVEELQRQAGKLHCLVNNAGANWAEPLEKFSRSGWNKTNDLNFTSVFMLTKCVLPLLKSAASVLDPARVINIASIDAITTPALETFAYSAGKAGVVHMSEVLAGRLIQDNITVNCILPGAFQSRMMRATIKSLGGSENLGRGLIGNRIGRPGDVAGTCLFLASSAGAWTTGAKLVLDGGAVVRPRL